VKLDLQRRDHRGHICVAGYPLSIAGVD